MVDKTIIQRIMTGPLAEFLQTYKVAIGIITAFVYVTIIIIFAINVLRLGSSASHPLMRRQAMISSNRDGGYSLYGARDIGPYKPGTGTPSENWAWENVWSNSQIEAAEVQQIIIFYQDGTVKSIEDPSRLIVS